MKTIRNVFWIVTLCFTTGGFAQDLPKFSIHVFEQIKDTLSFEEEIKSLAAQVKPQKITFTIQDMDAVITIGKELKANKGLGLAYDLKAFMYRILPDYKKALENHKEALVYFQKVNHTNGIRFSFKGIADIEYLRGNYQKSIDFGLEEKKHIQPTDSILLGRWYNRLGLINDVLTQQELAEEAFLNSISYSSSLDKNYAVLTSGNLARLYINQFKSDKALQTLHNALRISNGENGQGYVYYVYNTIAEVYAQKKEFQNAKKYIDSALQITKSRQLTFDTQRANLTLSEIEIELGNYDKADKLLKETIDFFKTVDSKPFLLYTYNVAVSLDSSRGNLKDALGWLKEYQVLSKQSRTEDSEKELRHIDADYKEELAQLQIIHQQEMKAQESASELFRSNLLIWVGIVVLLISLVLLNSTIRAKKKRKRIIKQLSESNAMKMKLFTIISHDLKNEIGSLESNLKMMGDGKMKPEQYKKLLPLLIRRTNQTSIILNNLLNWSKSQMKKLSADPSDFDVTEIITAKFSFFKPKALQKNIELINKLNASAIYADKNMISIVAQNLIANAIKFCKSGDSITLSSKERDGFLEIGFSDTGIGITPENLKRLFAADDTFTTRGTQNELGTGLGLKICKELIELNQGQISVESTPGIGTTFYVLLPTAAA